MLNLLTNTMDYVDIIHGKIVIPDFIDAIIKTSQFQRLAKISQLGMYHLAYPEANHTRYQHCIGTYHLANKTIDYLEQNTNYLKVPDFYRNVVGIAALLHDVGHGPLSHSWEFCSDKKYHHEDLSHDCIDEIFKTVSISWTDRDHNKEYAIELIKNLIVGNPSCLRDTKYRFLFEIVNNKQCEIDVDKWDYLKRDKKMMNTFVSNMDFDEVFMNARASDDRAHIEYHVIDYPKVYNLFKLRQTFHINFYQQPMLVCLEKILKHIIKNAHNLEQIDGLNILEVRSKHTHAFLKLHDEKILRILRAIQSPIEVVHLVKTLETCSIKEIYPATNDQKKSVPDYLQVNIKIPLAGVQMKEKDIIFYGDISDKPKIEKEMGYHESTSYFSIITSK